MVIKARWFIATGLSAVTRIRVRPRMDQAMCLQEAIAAVREPDSA